MGRTLSLRIGTALAALALLAGCTTHKQDTPSLTGPSALGTSLVVTVTPDVLNQDGSSQSLVQIQAYDNNGQPLRNKSLRVEIAVDGFITDFGKLSARSVVTDNNGRATATYTAPAAVLGITSTVNVNILVTPSETDFSNATTRSVTIHVVPTGTIGPPTSPFVPTFSPPSATVGNPATFTASFSGTSTNASVATFVWDFGDGDTAVGPTVTHTFGDPGTYLVTLGLVDTLGRTNSFSTTVTVGQGTVPQASFSFLPSSPAVGQRVTFDASTSTVEAGHRITDYSWNFGDGTSGGGEQATHAYAAAGDYFVTLRVTDDAGRTSSVSRQTITVGGTKPTASFTFTPSSPTVGQSVSFDGSSSTAPSGSTIASYAWTFDDGGTATGVNPSHTFAAAGSYQVSLVVTDSSGQTSTAATRNVSVSDVSKPTASFTYSPSSPSVGQTVTFNGTGSTAPSGRTVTGWAWNFGDGSAPASGATTTHAYSASGSYTATLIVTDSAGQTSAAATQTVNVGNPSAPTVSFTYVPTSPVAGQTVTFNASATASSGRTITSYTWDFGDGSPTGSGSAPTHIYATGGTYNVSVVVADSGSPQLTGTSSTSLFVSDGSASITITSGTSGTAGTNVSVSFDGTSSSAASGRSIVSYSWTFSNGGTATGPTVTHNFLAPSPAGNTQSFSATLTITDNVGHTNTVTKTFTVTGT